MTLTRAPSDFVPFIKPGENIFNGPLIQVLKKMYANFRGDTRIGEGMGNFSYPTIHAKCAIYLDFSLTLTRAPSVLDPCMKPNENKSSKAL